MPHPSTRRRVYRPDVDGLRAIAVLAVVLNHLDLGLPGGYVGVDIFFVISGWLITSNIVADIRSDSFSLRTFWSRRVRRLFPALFVVSLTTLIAGSIYLRPSLYEPLGLSLVYQSLLLSNHFFYTQTDYFAPAAEATPMLHVWSLAVEEQFYLLFPLIFYRRAGWSSADATQRVTAIVGVSFLLSIFMTRYDTQAAFFLLPYRIWELGAGAILALVNPPTMLRKRAVIESLSLVASLACLLPCLAYDDNWPFPGLSAEVDPICWPVGAPV